MRYFLSFIIFFSINTLLCQNYKIWGLKQLAFDAFNQKNYAVALNYFEKLSKLSPSNKNLFYTGLCQYKTFRYIEALETFEKLKKKNDKYYKLSVFYSGIIYRMLKEDTKAKKKFNSLLSITNTKSILYYKIKNQIISLNNFKDTSLLTSYKIKTMMLKDDNALHKFGVIIISDSSIILSQKNAVNKVYYRKFKIKNSIWIEDKQIPEVFEIDNDSNSAYGTYSLDGKYFFFVKRENNEYGYEVSQIYYRKKINEQWSTPIKLQGNINIPLYNSTQPTVGNCYSQNHQVIYFSSDRPEGYGGFDIYFFIYDMVHDTFSNAYNCGGLINSFDDEITPFYDNVTKTLYFSSNSYPGFGGFDIFKTSGELLRWSKPSNLGQPINSSFDDINLVKKYYSNEGFLLSNRNYNQCNCFDLFEFYDFKQNYNLLTGRVITYNNDPFKQLIDFSQNKINKMDSSYSISKNIQITIKICDSTGNYFTLFSTSTDSNGFFKAYLPTNEKFKIEFDSENINEYFFIAPTNDTTITFNLFPQKSTTNIVLKNILFDFNSAELTETSKKYLDSVIIPFLNTFQHIKIQIEAHTDNIGTEQYNLSLSEKRAEAVRDYLINKGIAPQRLKAMGYGNKKPLVNEKKPDGSDDPEARKINRRVEFKIIY